MRTRGSSAQGVVFVFACLVTLTPAIAQAQALPGGWSTTDIGAVGASGSASGSGESFGVTGAGDDIWNTADAFRFVYTALTGDAAIVARVTSLQQVADWA